MKISLEALLKSTFNGKTLINSEFSKGEENSWNNKKIINTYLELDSSRTDVMLILELDDEVAEFYYNDAVEIE